MPSKYDMAAKAREIVLSVRSTGDDATRICDGLIANNLGVISERVAAVVDRLLDVAVVLPNDGLMIEGHADKQRYLSRAIQALLELETEDET